MFLFVSIHSSLRRVDGTKFGTQPLKGWQIYAMVLWFSISTCGGFVFSQNGILVTLPAGVTYDEGGTLALLNRKGERLPVSLDSVVMNDPRFSPDDSRLTGFRRFVEVWIDDLERGTSTRLTSGSRTGWPQWTSDGRRVVYASERLGFWNIFWRAADGSDEERPVITTDSILYPSDWSPDDKKLLLIRDSQQTDSDVMIFDSADGKLHEFVATPETERDGIFSPDGKWIAYSSDESGHFEVYVRSFGGPEGRRQVSTNGGIDPMWKQQNEIIYREGEKVMRVPIQTEPSFSDRNSGAFIRRAISSDGCNVGPPALHRNSTEGKRKTGSS